MHAAHKQRGITLIGLIIVMAVVGFFAYAAMKLVPVYTEYFGVVKSMQAIAAMPNANNMTIEEIRGKLGLNFDLQYVDNDTIPPKAIKLETQDGARILHIVYDKTIPFLYNVSFLVHFDHAENLARVGSGV